MIPWSFKYGFTVSTLYGLIGGQPSCYIPSPSSAHFDDIQIACFPDDMHLIDTTGGHVKIFWLDILVGELKQP
ncbi:hypothetical protein K2173_008217 [Erythroxylum novogranatense]|uniref:Reverse transcriptase n=1 Tax=Erythroxylum novogranatense TaxID=1862640 RepID=A0AAV8S6W5_9ROSI|nr:hypothetical protein K2173_008217 [Erythroxylum novogranatense]